MAFKLFDYNSAGKGVAKHGPEKKPFFKFFEIFARKFWKLIEINMIFVLFCIPIVTFGPAVAAMTHVMRKFMLEQPCFVFDEFFTAFKKNFKQSFFVGIVDVICIVSLWIVCSAFFTDPVPTVAARAVAKDCEAVTPPLRLFENGRSILGISRSCASLNFAVSHIPVRSIAPAVGSPQTASLSDFNISAKKITPKRRR